MWTDVAMVFSDTSYTLLTLLSYRGFDTNWTSAVVTSWATSILNLILAVSSLMVFDNSYWIAYDQNEAYWEHVYNEAGFDEYGYDAEGYNGAGCNGEGYDNEGNACTDSFNEYYVEY